MDVKKHPNDWMWKWCEKVIACEKIMWTNQVGINTKTKVCVKKQVNECVWKRENELSTMCENRKMWCEQNSECEQVLWTNEQEQYLNRAPANNEMWTNVKHVRI